MVVSPIIPFYCDTPDSASVGAVFLAIEAAKCTLALAKFSFTSSCLLV